MGGSCILPSQDMVLGLYYMSLISPDSKEACFFSYSEVHKALLLEKVNFHTKIRSLNITNRNKFIAFSTPGRLLISEIVPLEWQSSIRMKPSGI